MINLTTARALVEKHLTDTCTISRDVEGVHDNVLDMATGQLIAPAGDTTQVYAGACLVAPTGIGQTVEGARVVERRGYRIRLPWDAPTFRRGDLVAITAAADPELTGAQMVLIDSSQGATMDHGTILTAQDVEAVAAS